MVTLIKKLGLLDKTGNIRVYEITLIRGNTAKIVTDKGILNGKMTVDVETYSTGKNIGRANETTPHEQAFNEYTSKINKLYDKGYVSWPCGQESHQSIEMLRAYFKTYQNLGSSGHKKPMRAYDSKKNPKKVDDILNKYGYIYMQPKLDGIRSNSQWEDGNISIFSRNDKKFNGLKHLEDSIKSILPNDYVLDGELYIHNKNFESIVSGVKSEKTLSEYSKDIKLLVYDLAIPGRYLVRKTKLHILSKTFDKNIQLVPTYKVHSWDEIRELHNKFIGLGYEGGMLRDPGGEYIFGGKRCWELMKVKEFDEDEFTITDIIPGKGRDAGTGIFEYITNEGKICTARSMGSLEYRKSLLSNRLSLLGKKVTIRFQGYTEDGRPRFPRAKIVRDYE